MSTTERLAEALVDAHQSQPFESVELAIAATVDVLVGWLTERMVAHDVRATRVQADGSGNERAWERADGEAQEAFSASCHLRAVASALRHTGIWA